MTAMTRLLTIASLTLALAAIADASPSTPAFDGVREEWRSSYGVLLDRDGVVLEADRLDFDGLRGHWVTLEDVSPALQSAIVSIEDQRFYEHGGVDWRALAAAAWQMLRGGGRRGASTITMQLAGLVETASAHPAGRRGLGAKWAQMRAAWRIEHRWSKAQILEAYLNRVSVRGELQGIAAASWSIYGKAPSGLTAAESWLLASLIAAPNAAPGRAATRACAFAARRAAEVGCDELEALARNALTRPQSLLPAPSLAPQLARRLLREPGQRVVTTLSAPIQRRARDVLARQLGSLDGRNVRDGAALVVDNATGEVLAYVGSAGQHSSASAVDGVRALRQAGSTLKPFLYGLAFERRYLTPASLLEDSPVNLETTTGLYIPQNYDRRYLGAVSARTALAGSLNIPAVRTLILVGVENFRDRLGQLGYDDLNRDAEHYGYSLALGSAEVSLLQQANAYRVLANGGLRTPLSFVPARTRRETRAARDARGGGVPGLGRPERSRRARIDLRAGEPARDARLGGGQDRDEQGHARQLVHRLLGSLHGCGLGRQLRGRFDARCFGCHRGRARMGRDHAMAARGSTLTPAACAGGRRRGVDRVRSGGRARPARVVSRWHGAFSRRGAWPWAGDCAHREPGERDHHRARSRHPGGEPARDRRGTRRGCLARAVRRRTSSRIRGTPTAMAAGARRPSRGTAHGGRPRARYRPVHRSGTVTGRRVCDSATAEIGSELIYPE